MTLDGRTQLFSCRRCADGGDALDEVEHGQEQGFLGVRSHAFAEVARAEIAKLQRVLGKKTLENEILKAAVEYATEKSGLRARPCCPGKTCEDGLPDAGVGALARA